MTNVSSIASMIDADVQRLIDNYGPDMLWYVAQPYSHPNAELRYHRYRFGAVATMELAKRGLKVFSPIAHSHPLEAHGDGPVSPDPFWYGFDRPLFERCDGLLLFKFPQWGSSKGIAMELGWAWERKMPVTDMSWALFFTTESLALIDAENYPD